MEPFRAKIDILKSDSDASAYEPFEVKKYFLDTLTALLLTFKLPAVCSGLHFPAIKPKKDLYLETLCCKGHSSISSCNKVPQIV